MRPPTIVVATLLGVALTWPALAQTSGWDSPAKAPAAKAIAAASQETTVSKKPAVVTKAAASKEKTPSPAHDAKAARVRLRWSEPAAASNGAASVLPHGRVVLLW